MASMYFFELQEGQAPLLVLLALWSLEMFIVTALNGFGQILFDVFEVLCIMHVIILYYPLVYSYIHPIK